jgi:hypothetical protein
LLKIWKTNETNDYQYKREGETMPRINLEKTDTFKKVNKRLNVKEIIENYLKKNRYDGLSCGCSIGCKIGELIDCERDPRGCMPGYIKDCKTCEKYKDGECIINSNYCIV